MDRLRILILAASPADQDRLKVEAEFKKIEDALGQATHRDRFQCSFQPAVGRADLVRRMLDHLPHVVHFSGHGTEADELILENDHGTSEPVGAEEVQQLFTAIPAAQRPHVAVFSACYSERQAQAITQVVDCAVGISSAIRDSAALAFAQGFYGALGRGWTLDSAISAGRFAMPSGIDVFPRLHLREGVVLEELRLTGEGPVSRFPADLHINRDEQIEELRGMLETGSPRVMVITADGNMGKTRLVRAMAAHAVKHPHALVDLTAGPELVIDLLADGIGASLTAPPVPATTARMGHDVNVAPPEAAARRDALVERTHDLFATTEGLAGEQGLRAVFLLDGLDDLSSDVARWVEQVFLPRAVRSDRVVSVIAGRGKPQLVTGSNFVREYQLANFGRKDVQTAMQDLHIDASDPVALTFWVATDRGHPYVTHAKLEELWREWRDAAAGRP